MRARSSTKPSSRGKETILPIDKDMIGPETRAFKALKKQATQVHSLRLASLAASIRTANAGNLQVVSDEDEKRVQGRKDEEQGDIDQRDWGKETILVKTEAKTTGPCARNMKTTSPTRRRTQNTR